MQYIYEYIYIFVPHEETSLNQTMFFEHVKMQNVFCETCV